ncbi:uncharacterized protein LOC143893930 isoform X2 [Temnothorax americanus]|uniref:uncharacterized protein LOC143893930 isoform X2 n=1 Tax=Temnothorax americanus TaxID=1964332 RepID=UPI004067A296
MKTTSKSSKHVIPKAGPRAKFCDKLESHKLDPLSTEISTGSASPFYTVLMNDSETTDITDEVCPSTSNSGSTIIFDNIVNVSQSDKEETTSHPNEAAPLNGKQDELNLNCKEKTHSRTNLVQLLSDTDLDVKAAIAVLTGVQDNKQKDTARNKLCSAIIKHELSDDENKKITNKRFEEIASQIQSAIPGEVQEAYYIPYKRYSTGKKVNAKGKLYDKYTNYLKHLRVSGLRQKRKRDSTDSDESAVNSAVNVNDDLLGKLEWLYCHKDPYEEVKEKWDATHEVRLAQLRRETGSVYDYIIKYGALQLTTGYKLLLADFKKLYPDYDTRMWSKWTEFARKASLLLSLEDNCHLNLFLKLGHLFSPVPVPLTNGKRWKPTTQEMIDGFILHVKVMNDLVPNVERIRSKAQHMKTKIQPLVIAVGPTVSLCKDFYVVIDKNYYRFDNIRTAVDVCFKCVHALHAEYSPQSEAIWYFLQLALYDLRTQWDKTIPQVSKQLKCLSEK